MNRYIAAQIIQNPITRKRNLSSTIFSQVPTSPGDIYIRTTSAERLDKLALAFYKDETTWPVIAVANAIGKGSLMVLPNTLLRIPDPELVRQNMNQITNR